MIELFEEVLGWNDIVQRVAVVKDGSVVFACELLTGYALQRWTPPMKPLPIVQAIRSPKTDRGEWLRLVRTGFESRRGYVMEKTPEGSPMFSPLAWVWPDASLTFRGNCPSYDLDIPIKLMNEFKPVPVELVATVDEVRWP